MLGGVVTHQNTMTKQTSPDLTSVRTLIPSTSKLARHFGLSLSAIYRWIEVNRIPGAHIVRVAQFYDVEIVDLLHLTGSEKAHMSKALVKSKAVLPALLEVYRGAKTLEAACEEVGIPVVSGKLIMMHWGDELPTLYTTLTQLHEKRISLEMAMHRLNVTKNSLHDLRRKYGFAPRAQEGYTPKVRSPQKRVAKWQEVKPLALQVIAGRMTAVELASAEGTPSYRTIFRYVEKLTHLKLNDLTHWPEAFRAALAYELEHDTTKYAEKWVKFAEEQRLILRKVAKYPAQPKDWKVIPLKRLLVAVLLGEKTLAEVAEAKGGDPKVFENLFTSDLRPLDLTFAEVHGMSVSHQVALSELLLAVLDRRRKLPVTEVPND